GTPSTDPLETRWRTLYAAENAPPHDARSNDQCADGASHKEAALRFGGAHRRPLVSTRAEGGPGTLVEIRVAAGSINWNSRWSRGWNPPEYFPDLTAGSRRPTFSPPPATARTPGPVA